MKARLAGFRQGLERRGWSEGRNVRIDTRFAARRRRSVAGARERAGCAATRRDPRAFDAGRCRAAAGEPHDPDRVRQRLRPDRLRLRREPGAAGRQSHGPAACTRRASSASGWRCSRRSRRASRAPLSWPTPRRPAYEYYLAGGQSHGAVARDRACAQSGRDTPPTSSAPSSSFARVPNGGLFLPPDTTTIVHRDLIIALAARHRLPAVYAFRYFVAAGGLMSYGTDQVDMFRQAASYVDRILRGAKPADLPVQAPTKYETTLNLKTAKALGLDVPPALLVARRRGDRMRRGASSSRCSAARRRRGRSRRARSSRRCRYRRSHAAAAAMPQVQSCVAAFRQGLQESVGSTAATSRSTIRWADGNPIAYRAIAAEFVALTPTSFWRCGRLPVALACKATPRPSRSYSPVVGDPVGVGFVASLARPGGNVTGFTAFE